MATATDFPAKGKVIRVEGEYVVFAPSGTNYELKLKGSFSGVVGEPVALLIRAVGRKLMTVPSGGNFVAPIFGTPKTFQGRVKYADETQVVVHAGVTVIIKFPPAEDALDLAVGAVTVGHMINVIVYPEVTFEVVKDLVGV